MSLRLLVAGRRSDDVGEPDDDMDEVAARSIETDTFQVRRCDTPRDLPEIVETVARRFGKLSVLDLYDHGNIGRMWLGDDILFASDAEPHTDLVGRAIATDLAPFLDDTAHVRLLGCMTTGPEDPVMAGRLLLIKLARALGGRRIAFGTIITIERHDFGTYGYRTELDEARLFSSLAAVDGDPPDSGARKKHLAAVRPRPINT